MLLRTKRCNRRWEVRDCVLLDNNLLAGGQKCPTALLAETNLCATSTGSGDICNGDSGGGLVTLDTQERLGGGGSLWLTDSDITITGSIFWWGSSPSTWAATPRLKVSDCPTSWPSSLPWWTGSRTTPPREYSAAETCSLPPKSLKVSQACRNYLENSIPTK